ncbi:MAG: hypothetical protein AAGA56_17125, partial [Myxococcota bacterium]
MPDFSDRTAWPDTSFETRPPEWYEWSEQDRTQFAQEGRNRRNAQRRRDQEQSRDVQETRADQGAPSSGSVPGATSAATLPDADSPSDQRVRRRGNFSHDSRGEEQWAALNVAAVGRHAYLRLGRVPSRSYALDGEEKAKTHLGIWNGNCQDNEANWAKGFAHGPEGSTKTWFEEAAWIDHAEGHRMSSTTRDRVEYVEGNYKIISCAGACGIDMSAGHLMMWSKSPGYQSQVTTDGKNATEYIKAEDNYHHRMESAVYDEVWAVGEFHAYFGVPSPIAAQVGKPPMDKEIPGPEGPLNLYREEIYAVAIEEFFETTDHHHERVIANHMDEVREITTGSVDVTAAD